MERIKFVRQGTHALAQFLCPARSGGQSLFLGYSTRRVEEGGGIARDAVLLNAVAGATHTEALGEDPACRKIACSTLHIYSDRIF